MRECMFGEILRNERERQGISRAKLAEMAGFTSRVIYYWENGHHDISLKNAEIVANALGITIIIGKKKQDLLE